MKFILGKKQNMTQIFDEEGRVHPVTLIKAFPLSILRVKTKEKDGYKSSCKICVTANKKQIIKSLTS